MASNTGAKVGSIVEHLFRQDAGKVIAILTGIFGLRNLELIEDAVQEALLKALRQWSYGTIPKNPSGWLVRVARNHALDVVRRNARFREREAEIVTALEQVEAIGPGPDPLDKEIKDDQLRMIFACCHPALSRESQITLTLKTLCGFNIDEIARAFLISSDAIAQRLTRARQRLQKDDVVFEIPGGSELPKRLDSVLVILYLLFNEGYNASEGGDVIREDLCKEAIRLASLVREHGATARPKVEALLALMLFQAARFSSRSDSQGEILLLQEQDRTKWDREMIGQALKHLNQSAMGEEATAFHLQAGIAACHCTAVSYEATDWQKILDLYDILLRTNNSPVIALNRAIALSKVRGPEAGLMAVCEIKNSQALRKYYLYYAVQAEFHRELGEYMKAAEDYGRALVLTKLPAEKAFLATRLRAVQKSSFRNS
jgi:RNA polymerase sigma factor (sigma-70 family)